MSLIGRLASVENSVVLQAAMEAKSHGILCNLHERLALKASVYGELDGVDCQGRSEIACIILLHC
jgi:hypothetical protein